jgi:urease accessory protein
MPLFLISRFFLDIVTIVFTDRLSHQDRLEPTSTLSLTAEERTQIALQGYSDQGLPIALKLDRGTILQEGDWLRASTGELIQVLAKKEFVLTITSLFPLALLQAAYHLGNRRIALEITTTHLRILPDNRIKQLLEHQGLTITEEIAPFQPEIHI